MTLLNSIKLLFSNFSLVYKTFIYKLFAFIVSLAGSFVFSLNAIAKLKVAGVFYNFKNAFTSGIENFIPNISQAFGNLFDACAANLSGIVLPIIISCLVFMVIGKTLISMDTIAIDSCIETKMSANYKSSYIANFLKNFWNALLYSFIKALLFVIFDVLLIYGVIKLYPLVVASSLFYLWIFLIVVCLIIYFALKNTFVCFFSPSVVVSQESVAKSFRVNFKLLFKNFWVILGYNFVLILIFLVVNLLFGLLTFGVSFLYTIPQTIILKQTFNMTAYFEVTGNRYYIDENNIRSPKKQNEKQKISDILDLI